MQLLLGGTANLNKLVIQRRKLIASVVDHRQVSGLRQTLLRHPSILFISRSPSVVANFVSVANPNTPPQREGPAPLCFLAGVLLDG